jgi:hypothetical protein
MEKEAATAKAQHSSAVAACTRTCGEDASALQAISGVW